MFTRELQSNLSATCTITQSTDLWRDVGWEFGFTIDEEDYRGIVACTARPGELLLQVSPRRTSNVVLKCFGVLPSATDAGLVRRRTEISHLLQQNPHITSVLFAYDRFPA